MAYGHLIENPIIQMKYRHLITLGILLIILKISSCQCESNQYYDANVTCQDCDSSCQTCYNATYCTTCSGAYNLSNNLCLPCPVNCLMCVINISQCQSCRPGYLLEIDSDGVTQVCVLHWWYIFAIVFGTLAGALLLVGIIWFVKKKLNN